ncbi:MAG: lipid II flippase MurJ [Ktedonobacteraceae bacterium]
MSRPAQPLNTTSARILGMRLKSVNMQIVSALLSLASAALLVRVAGMVNQVIVSSRFGAGTSMDAYFIASTLPILLAQIIEHPIQDAVIPVYTRVRTQETKERSSQLFSTLLNLSILGGLLVTLMMFIFRSQVLFLSAPGSNSAVIELAINLTPFIFPVFLLTILIGYLECILNTEGQFGWPAYAGIVVPLTTAVFVFAAGASLGVVMLCVGTVVGLGLNLGVILLRSRRAGLSYRPVIHLHDPALAAVMIVAWPVLFGALLDSSSPLVDQIFSSFLSAGSISAISYASKIIGVFTGVMFAAVGRAAHPLLSRQASNNDMQAFKETLHFYLWIMAIGVMVLSILVIIFAHPLVQLLFQRGAFSTDDTNRTAIVLVGFAIGLAPMSLTFILPRAFSALGKTRVLMYVALFTVISNAVLDYIFSHYLQSFGIALATSATYVGSMLILLFVLQHMLGGFNFFTPPREVRQLPWELRRYYQRWNTWKHAKLFGILPNTRRQLARLGVMLAVFAVGVAGVILNSLYTLRAALASILILVFVRYPYVLLLVWALFNAPNDLPIFRGSNLLIGLTVPTLILMAFMPIKQTFKRLPALAFMFIYLLWVFASIGVSPLGAGTFLVLWTELLNCVAIGILTINVLTTRRRLLGLIDTILLLSTLVALYGIYGYITRQNGELDSPGSSLFRIASIFAPVATSLALFLSLVIPLGLYRTFTLQGFKRTGASIMVLILVVALGLTFTRAAYIGLLLSIIILLLFLPSRRMKIGLLINVLAVAAVMALLAALGNVPLLGRFFAPDVATLNGRTFLWQAVLSHFDPTRLLGQGFDASETLLTFLQTSVIYGNSPHSLFLGTLYDQGIIGVLLLTVMFIALITNIIAGMRKAAADQDRRLMLAMALAVTVSAVVESIDSNNLWTQAISIYFWIIIALPFALCWPRPHAEADKEKEYADAEEDTVPRMEAIRRKEQEQLSHTVHGREEW